MKANAQGLVAEATKRFKAGEAETARDLARLATETDPASAAGWYVLASSLQRLGPHAAARTAFRRVLALQPSSAPGLAGMAANGEAGGLPTQAARFAELAFCAGPAHRETARLLARHGRRIGLLRDAASRFPDSAEIWTTLGDELPGPGLRPEARAALRRAQLLDPVADRAMRRAVGIPVSGREADASLSLVRHLGVLDRSSTPLWLRVVAAQPEMLEIGETGAQLGRRLAAAVDDLADRLEGGPNPVDARRLGGVTLFRAAYWGIDDTAMLARFGGATASLAAASEPVRPLRASGSPTTDVALVSGHARRHSIWTSIGNFWATALRRSGVRTTLYDLYGTADAAIRALFDRVEAGPRSREDWIEAIHRAGHQVLLFPELGSEPVALAIANRRLAPTQVASWGHPTTSGLPTVDLYLGAERFDPPGAESQYTERLVRLPGVGTEVWSDEFTTAARTGAPADLGLAPGEGALVVCQSAFKYLPDFDDCLAEIASRHPPSRFLAFESGGEAAFAIWRRRVSMAFVRRGLDPDRHLRFMPRLAMVPFQKAMSAADGYLDPFTFSGFVTGLRAIEAGCPPVTLEGGRLRERLCAGLLREGGAPATIAASREQYVEIAIRLMTDKAFASDCRDALAGAPQALRRENGVAAAFLQAIGVPS